MIQNREELIAEFIGIGNSMEKFEQQEEKYEKISFSTVNTVSVGITGRHAAAPQAVPSQAARPSPRVEKIQLRLLKE